MKFKIKQSVLKKEMPLLSSVIFRRSTNPILSNAVLKALPVTERLIIKGTNLVTWAISSLDAEIALSGECCVNFHDLKRIVAVCGEEIEFELIDGWLKISSNKAVWQLAAIGVDQYPECPQFAATHAVMPLEQWKAAIARTKFAVTKEQSRFTLQGAQVIFNNDFVMAATDGHRLALWESKKVKTRIKFEAIIPAFALSLFDKIKEKDTVRIGADVQEKLLQRAITKTVSAQGALPDKTQPARKEFIANHMFFEVGHRRIITRCLRDAFPNFNRVLPTDTTRHAKFDVLALRAALHQAAVTADDRTRQICWTFQETGVSTIKSRRFGEGSFSTELVAALSKKSRKDEITLGFNLNYLTDICKLLSGVCALDFTDVNSPVVFEPNDQPDKTRFRYILMPLRV